MNVPKDHLFRVESEPHMKTPRMFRASFATPDSWPPSSLQLSDEEVAELEEVDRIAYQSRLVNYQIAIELVRESWKANEDLFKTMPTCWNRKDYLQPHIGLPPTWRNEIMLHVSQSVKYLKMITDRLEAALGDGLVSAPVLQEFVEAVLRDLLTEHQFALEWNGKVLLIKRVESQPHTAA